MSVRMPALKLSRRGAKILGAVVLGVLLLAGLAAWQVPKVVRGVLTGDVAALLGRQISVGDISFNPFTLTVRAHDLVIAQPQADTPLLKVARVQASAAWSSLFWFAPVLDSVSVIDPQVTVVREDVTQFSFSDIQQKLAGPSASPPAEGKADAGLPRFSLNNLRLEGGSIVLDDKVTGRKQVIDQISLGVPFISTFGYATDIDVQPSLHMRVNGSAFTLDGVARPFDKVPYSTLNLDFSGLELEKWADIWPLALPLTMQRGLLDSALQIRFEQPRDAAPAIRIVGDVGLRQWDLREASGDDLLKWSSVVVRRIDTEPLKQQLRIGEVEVWAPQVQTRRYADQRINWLDVIGRLQQALGGKQAAPQAATPPWQVAVDAVNVHDAEVRLRDAPSGLDYWLAGLDLTVETIQWPQPPQQPIRIWANMENRADGGWLRAKGPLTLAPLDLDLDLHMGNIALAPFAPAVRAAAPIVVQDGRLALDGRVRVATAGDHAQASAQNVRLALSRVRARDEGISPAVEMSLGQLDLSADRLALGAAPTAFTVRAADLQGKGQLAMQGVLTTAPLTLKSHVDLTALDLAPFAPYVASSLNATLRAITVGASGQLAFSLAHGDTPTDASWHGAAEISDFDLQDRVNKADFLNWRKLALSNMQVQMRGEQVSAALGDIVLDDFFGRVLLNAEGRLNVMDLVAEPGQAAGSITQDTQTRTHAAPASAPAALPEISVNSVTLTHGRMNFTDRFVKPNYTAELSAIEGSVSAVSSRSPKPAQVKIGGRVYTTAPFSISGTVQPFAQYLALDLKASAKGVDLPRFTTYSAKYVGYPIKRGKLSLDVEYQIKNRALQASNRVVLNQLTLGDKTDSKDALQLPVLLAVALLKDSKGNIDINLPISGSLDDPQFSVGGIIVRVFVNLIVKAVTAPFNLLAAAFGGGEELSYVEFAPGSADLSADSLARLQTLAKALNDRPSLKLDIAGRADPRSDEDGLRQAWVERQIRLAKVRDTAGSAKRPPDLATVTLTEAERAKYLEKVYDDTKIEGKPRNFIGMAKSIPAQQMEALLRGAARVSQDDLRRLADARAQAVFEKLQDQGPADRIFIVAPVLDADGIKDDGMPSRVDFSLK
ncbi:DUF748 domain-containing protein [Bordetella genomosp. 12]|uniref:DUF748 domain-containing protein n=1 Tax=Bordetella genomosp. 12 TaxID=463035 RepID=A0A261VBP3_9BORD|nr:DUF748 domain-containing protein [Bordetella genomosp. 12]OZI71181.1 hypothetical protein CAL22_15085 [Bordetella genomosp. 12]